jgi:iron(III) transport system ATP-binding protein
MNLSLPTRTATEADAPPAPCRKDFALRTPGFDDGVETPTRVTVSRLGFAYRRGPRVLHEVDLELHAGRVHCLLGDSGSGKSTLLRLIAGLERPDAGRVSIDGECVADAGRCRPPERRPVGVVFQDYALFPHFDARRNVCFGMRNRPRRERRAAADQLLARVGMAGFERAMPHTLSGGQQQRVALARALARDPRVMLLDEPFTGLDAALRDRVRETTLRVLRNAGVAVLMVTHDPREALAAADRVSVMRQGRVLVTGRPQDVCVRRWSTRREGDAEVCHECIDVIDGTGPAAVTS